MGTNSISEDPDPGTEGNSEVDSDLSGYIGCQESGLPTTGTDSISADPDPGAKGIGKTSYL